MHPEPAAPLDSMLTRLAAEAALPAAPDLEARVMAKLSDGRAPARRRRALVPRVAAAAAITAAGVALALSVSNDAREAVAEFLGLGVAGERIELSRDLPVERVTLLGPTAAAAEPSSLEDAEARLGFEPRLPRDAKVERVFLLRMFGLDGVVLRTARFDLWQFRNGGELFLAKGGVDGTVSVEEVRVGGRRAYWVVGGPRMLTVRDASGDLATGVAIVATAHVLVVADGPYTFRIEGDLSLDEALAVAESLLE